MSEKIRHTAGPWEYGPARNYVGFYIAPKGTRPTLTAVERSWGSGDVINVECFNFPGETEANARLISAAPDFDEAARAVVSWFDAVDRDDNLDRLRDALDGDMGVVNAREAIDLLRAALAKATTAPPKEAT